MDDETRARLHASLGAYIETLNRAIVLASDINVLQPSDEAILRIIRLRDDRAAAEEQLARLKAKAK
jgi:hypothetical protein